MIRFCGSRRTRDTAFSPDSPTDWRPQSLVDPRPAAEGRTYFTDDAAWLFIAERLGEPNLEAWEIELTLPVGKKAWCFVVPGHPPVRRIYVKLQLLGDRVRGRSFHESYSPVERE